jgi:hypothetical protein
MWLAWTTFLSAADHRLIDSMQAALQDTLLIGSQKRGLTSEPKSLREPLKMTAPSTLSQWG